MPSTAPDGPAAASPAARRRPWLRLAALPALPAAAAAFVAVWQPQRHPAFGAPGAAGFVLVYALCALAFVPRPLLNTAAGALLGAWTGTAAALAGTVLAAAASFWLGRTLGRDALRPLWRRRAAAALDRQLSEHGFRSVLAMRLLPGMPFPAATYLAAASGTGWTAFLLATAVGSVPNTAAYAVAGARAVHLGSAAFLTAAAVVAAAAAVAPAAAWRVRGRLRRAGARRAAGGVGGAPAAARSGGRPG